MKKILTKVAIVSFFVLSSPVLASVDTVGVWNLNAPTGINFVCGGPTYSHTLNTVTQDVNGNLTGAGTYDPNNGYTWDLVGDITGNTINFTITYTGISSGSVYNSVGTIAPDGSISGTTDSNCQSFSMPAGSASAFNGNHGQYVRSQDDKKAAAQSRVGMPVQSKGHTK